MILTGENRSTGSKTWHCSPKPEILLHCMHFLVILCCEIASCRRDVASVTNKGECGMLVCSDNNRRIPTHSERKLPHCHFVHRTGLPSKLGYRGENDGRAIYRKRAVSPPQRQVLIQVK
jgi:hypothetical protein